MSIQSTYVHTFPFLIIITLPVRIKKKKRLDVVAPCPAHLQNVYNLFWRENGLESTSLLPKIQPLWTTFMVSLGLTAILVHSGCCDKILQTEQLTNSRNVFLSVLEARSQEIRTAARSRPGEGPLPGCRLLAVYSCDRSGEGSLWSLSDKGTNPTQESLTP